MLPGGLRLIIHLQTTRSANLKYNKNSSRSGSVCSGSTWKYEASITLVLAIRVVHISYRNSVEEASHSFLMLLMCIL